MINFRVSDLNGLLENLAAKGIARVGEMMEEPYRTLFLDHGPGGRQDRALGTG